MKIEVQNGRLNVCTHVMMVMMDPDVSNLKLNSLSKQHLLCVYHIERRIEILIIRFLIPCNI